MTHSDTRMRRLVSKCASTSLKRNGRSRITQQASSGGATHGGGVPFRPREAIRQRRSHDRPTKHKPSAPCQAPVRHAWRAPACGDSFTSCWDGLRIGTIAPTPCTIALQRIVRKPWGIESITFLPQDATTLDLPRTESKRGRSRFSRWHGRTRQLATSAWMDDVRSTGGRTADREAVLAAGESLGGVLAAER